MGTEQRDYIDAGVCIILLYPSQELTRGTVGARPSGAQEGFEYACLSLSRGEDMRGMFNSLFYAMDNEEHVARVRCEELSSLVMETSGL